ncbi:outer membrane protein assembly factor BamB family protein [Sunxiuqinia sp. A32]|uniref:outer membrane protein assembly factor BamB family protein n=1 Tax=Sunxiuqinia sp. A32 TaxID=3461496 RepID=UPI00404659DB
MKTLFFLLLIFLTQLVSAQSSRWRGTNQDGRYPDTDLMEKWPEGGLSIKTTYTGIGEGYGSPSITEDGIFVGGMHDSTGYVHHFSHDGKLIWKTSYGNEFTFRFPGSRATPTIEQNRLYYSGGEGDAICLDTKTGNIIWHINLFKKYDGDLIKWGYTESPLVYKNLVIYTPGGPDVSMVALDKMNGSVVWEMSMEGGFNAYCSPQLIKHNNQTLAMVNLSNYLVIFDPANGSIKYKHDITNSRNNHSMEPIYIDGKILYSAGYGYGTTLYELNDHAGMDTIFHNSEFDCKMSGMMRIGDLIYGTADNKKHWAALNWKTGEVVFTSRELKPGSFIMADDKFYIFTEMGEIALAKPNGDGFEVLSKFECPAYPAKYAFAHPVIYQGDLFIRFNDSIWRYKIKE